MSDLMPSDIWSMTAFVVDAGLVIHAPAAADKLQATLVHQTLHHCLRVVILLPVPAPEERRLHVDEAAEREGVCEIDSFCIVFD